MQKIIRKTVPDWLLIILASKFATTIILLNMGFG